MFSRSKSKKPKGGVSKLVISTPTPIAPIRVNGPYIDLRASASASASTPALLAGNGTPVSTETKPPVTPVSPWERAAEQVVSAQEIGRSASAPLLVDQPAGEETRGRSDEDTRERQVAACRPVAPRVETAPVLPRSTSNPQLQSFNFSRKMMMRGPPPAAPTHDGHVTPGRSDNDDMNNIRGRPREKSLRRQQRPELRIEPNFHQAQDVEEPEAGIVSKGSRISNSSSVYSSRPQSPAAAEQPESFLQLTNTQSTSTVSKITTPQSADTVVTILDRPSHLRHLRQYSDSPTIGLESPESPGVSPNVEAFSQNASIASRRQKSPLRTITASPIDQRLDQLGKDAFDLVQLLSPVGTVQSGDSVLATASELDEMGRRPSISSPTNSVELPAYLGPMQDISVASSPSVSEADKPRRSLSRKVSQRMKGFMGAKKDEGKVTKDLISRPMPITNGEKMEDNAHAGEEDISRPSSHGQDPAQKVHEWNYTPSAAKASSLKSSGPSLVSLMSSNNPGLSSHPSSLHSFERGGSPPSPVSPVTPEADTPFDTIRGRRLGEKTSDRTIRTRDTYKSTQGGEEVPVFLDTSSEISVPSVTHEPPTPRNAQFEHHSRSRSLRSHNNSIRNGTVRSGSVASSVVSSESHHRERSGSIASSVSVSTRSNSIVPSEPETAESQPQPFEEPPSLLDDRESFLRPRVAPSASHPRHSKRDSNTSSHSSSSNRSSRSTKSTRSIKSPISTAPSSTNPSPMPSPALSKSRFSTASRSTMRSTAGPKLLRSSTMSSRSNAPIRRPTTTQSSQTLHTSDNISVRRPSYATSSGGFPQQDTISVISQDEITLTPSALHGPSPLSQNFPEEEEPPISPNPFDQDRSLPRSSTMSTASARPSLKLARSLSSLRTSRPFLPRASVTTDNVHPVNAASHLTLQPEFSESRTSLASTSSAGPFDLDQPSSPVREVKRTKSLGSLRRAFSKRSTKVPPIPTLSPPPCDSPTPPIEEEVEPESEDAAPPLPKISQASLARWNTVRSQTATIRKLTAAATPPPVPVEPHIKAKSLTEEELAAIARLPGTIFLKTEIAGEERKHQLKPRKGTEAGQCAFCKRGPFGNMWVCADRELKGPERCTFVMCRMCANEKVQAGEAELF